MNTTVAFGQLESAVEEVPHFVKGYVLPADK